MCTQRGSLPAAFGSTCCEREYNNRGDDLLARGSYPNKDGMGSPTPQRGFVHGRFSPAPLSQTQTQNQTQTPICGIGMGFDSSLLEARRGAIVACIEKGGPADKSGDVQIGDQVVYVDDLDIRELMNDWRGGHFDLSKGVRPVLAHYLHGEPGTSVRIGLMQEGSTTIVHTQIERAPLNPGCQWIVAANSGTPGRTMVTGVGAVTGTAPSTPSPSPGAGRGNLNEKAGPATVPASDNLTTESPGRQGGLGHLRLVGETVEL
eukprot:CAMPEP_0177717100 /NCGR_PEP_ID=MMETSP0484_2-20121128/14851_1 /TAXON_ID=354590 /ORGANISM="Rhodomonas lens, Strain RHODO" /LENGTH=260 /DNA_ID=CAMNT_0019229151 /DNA_START=151 /DNA_END=934 /DNA_ORIENTATION=-